MSEHFEKQDRATYFENIEELNPLWRLPKEFVHAGPTYTAIAKDRRVLTGETYGYNVDECKKAGFGDITEGLSRTDMVFLLVRDSTGKIVGTRISSLHDTARGWRYPYDQVGIRSRIRVFEKGRGYATPVEEMFQEWLQDLANTRGKEVCWEVSNENEENLRHYRESENPDLQILADMELEQERWLHLYGEGGKFGIDENGQKKFYPKI